MPTFRPAALVDWVETVLTAVETPTDNARTVARSLVSADLRGHSSHGVRLLPMYLDRIGSDEQNRIDPTTRPRVERREGPRVLLDGNDAFGRVVGEEATELAIELTREYGLAVVGIRDGNHLGRMGEWAETAAEAGLLTLSFIKGEAAFVAPPGSTDRRLSTNPIAAGVPTFDALPFPIVLDIATSVVAGGKTWERRRAGKALPERWVVTDDGEFATAPDALAGEGSALLPLGGTTAGHKGFGLAVVAELVGALVGNGIVAGERDHVHFNNTVGLVAIDPTWFTPCDGVESRVRALAEYLRETPLQAGLAAETTGGVVMLPGEVEHRHELANRRSGLTVADETVADLNASARCLSCEPLGDTDA